MTSLADVVGDRIPADIAAWVEELTGGTITHLERNVSRREGWILVITRPDGGPEECFLRLDRDTEPGSTIKEARVVEALQDTGVLVPKIFGRNDSLQAALYSRVPGRADLNHAEPGEQRAVFEHFMKILAELHTLDCDALDLDDILERPKSAFDAAFLEVDKLQAVCRTAELGEPLVTFGIEWLRLHAPATINRVSLLQGDTGPANFMFAAGGVTAVIDWEWAHFGDPMEDLGNVAYRNMFHPSGNLVELIPIYRMLGGDELDYDRIYYYRAQQAVRSVIALERVTLENDPNTPVALNLAYRLINDRITCEAISDAMGVTLRRPEPAISEASRPGHTLGEVAVDNLTREVLPLLTDDWARYRIRDVVVLVQCMDRVTQYESVMERIDLEEINQFLGATHPNLSAALSSLNEQIPDLMKSDEVALLGLLARRAYRAEELYRPAVDMFPERKFGPIR